MRKAAILRLIVASTLVGLGLAACGVVRSQQREGTLRDALTRGDLQTAQQQIVTASRARWRQDSEALIKAHGAMRIPVASGGQDGFPPGFAKHHAIFRIAFADGYERCLWVEGRGGGELALVNNGYVDCGTIPAPSVSHGTPSLPGSPAAAPTP